MEKPSANSKQPPANTTKEPSNQDEKLHDKELGLKNDQHANSNNNSGGHGITVDHPTTYAETLIHLFKGNVGPGLFAMGDAFKNSGLIAGPFLTMFVALVCIHCQHILLSCATKLQKMSKTPVQLDFAETVEQCFANGPTKLRRWSSQMKTAVNIFICVTQLGFCCIYFVFISKNINQVLDYHGWVVDDHIVMAITFIPILLPSLITNLKFLAPVSGVANVCMILSLTITMYYAFKDGLTHPSERNYFATPHQLALYFGTAMYAFEGIALVIPLKSEMLKPKLFARPLGVLNVGMGIVSLLFVFTGFFGYLKWGEETKGSLTLNLDVSEWLAQVVKITVSLGVLLGYPLQFFIAIGIMWPRLSERLGVSKHPVMMELAFRTIMVLLTFVIAELVPKLELFISLIGALCSTALALVFPPMIELVLSWNNAKGPGCWIFCKNIFILILALFGFCIGSYESITTLVRALIENKD